MSKSKTCTICGLPSHTGTCAAALARADKPVSTKPVNTPANTVNVVSTQPVNTAPCVNCALLTQRIVELEAQLAQPKAKVSRSEYMRAYMAKRRAEKKYQVAIGQWRV